MKFSLLLVVLLTQVLPPAPDPSASLSPDGGWVDVEPDVVTRGRATTIVVTGAAVEAVKTLQFTPSDGIRVDGIRALPSRNGKPEAEVTLTVSASAEPGDRAIMLTVAPNIGTASATRPGGDPLSTQLDAAFLDIVKRESKPAEMGSLRVNSHEISIVAGDIISGARSQLRVIVNDPRGDIDSGSPAVKLSSSAGFGIAQFTQTITAEVRCADETLDLFIDDPTIERRTSSSIVLVADVIEADSLTGKRGCELRVRVLDREGNLSLWFTRPLGA